MNLLARVNPVPPGHWRPFLLVCLVRRSNRRLFNRTAFCNRYFIERLKIEVDGLADAFPRLFRRHVVVGQIVNNFRSSMEK